MHTQPLIFCAQIGVITAARAASVGEDENALLIIHERSSLGEIGRWRARLDKMTFSLAHDAPASPRHFRYMIGAEALDDLVECAGDRRQHRQLFDQPVAPRHSFTAEHGLAIAINGAR